MKDLGQKEALALYRPADEIKQKLGEITLWAFVGPYGSGKDSVMDFLQAYMPSRFARVVGDTTRSPRKGEKKGVTYNFRTKKEMIEDLNEGRFVQVAPGTIGNFYGTRPDQYPVGKIAMMAIQAAEMENFQSLGFKEVKWLLIVPRSDEDWQQWQSGNIQSPEDKKQRDDEAIRSYTLSLTNASTRYVLNDEIEKAAQRVIRLSDGRKIPDETLAKSTAHRNLSALKRRRH